MRINHYLASCGVSSRRKAEEFIKLGLVSINDKVITELSTVVKQDDVVKFKGKLVKPEENKVCIMLNKPKGYITAVSDDRGRPTVMKLLPKMTERVFPIGRLDYNTEGLLLLTNDGDLANNITHPTKHISKTYEVLLKVKPSTEALQKLRSGVELDGIKTLPAIISKPKNEDGLYKLEVTIHEGKNRQVRRMFEYIGIRIYSLKRVSIGGLKLGDLELKKCKYLTDYEIKTIFR